MSASSKSFKCGAVAAFAVLSGGCPGGLSIDQVVGHYEGFVVTSEGTGPSSQQAVAADISQTSVGSIAVAVSGERLSAPIALEVSFTPNGRMSLSSSSGFFPGALALRYSGGSCFNGGAGGPKQNQLCLGGREIQLSLGGLGIKLVLDKMQPRAEPVRETPAPYTIDALMDRSKTRNFDNQVQFEAVVQARLTARNAYLNLFPHFNSGTGLTLGLAALGSIPAAILTIVRSIGDLVPFVLPSRWLAAQADAAETAANLDAYRILQASTMNIVYSLATSVLRDEESLELLEENRLEIIHVRDIVINAERTSGSGVQVGQSKQISVALDGVEGSIIALQEALNEELTALSQASGFINPGAIERVEPVAVGPVDGPIGGSKKDWENLAVARSIDLLQMDDLAVYAMKTRALRKWAWLDPVGDDSGSIGLGLIDYIAVGNSMVSQVYDKKNSTEVAILKKVDDTLTQSVQVFRDRDVKFRAASDNEGVVQMLLDNIDNGIAVDMGNLSNALLGKASADLARLVDEYAFLTLKSQMDFLTYSGKYADVVVSSHH